MTLECPIPARYVAALSELKARPGQKEPIAAAKALVPKFLLRSERDVEDPTERSGFRTVHVPAKHPSKGLLLSGPTGTGKSTILGALASDLWILGHDVAWIRWDELTDAMQYREGSEPAQVRALARVPALFLDELGLHQPLPHVQARVHGLVEARYGAKLPLFATTNCDEAELSAALGVAAVSRTFEMAEAWKVVGPDARRAK